MILYNPTVSGSLVVTGSLTTTGTITSQTLVVQTITSSIEFNTGSTRNGTLSTNTHEFTGSVSITGSAAALLNVNNGVLYVSSSGNVGIGTTSPDIYSRAYTTTLGISSSTGDTGIMINGGTSSGAYIDLGTAGTRNMGIISTTTESQIISLSTIPLVLKTNGVDRMRITSDGNIVRGSSREFTTNLFPSNPYTSDLQLTVTHTGWGSNYDSGIVFVEFLGRTYGSNQLTSAFGTITYKMDTNGSSINTVSTAGVTLSNVTISTDVATSLILKITFQVAANADRLSVYARTLNQFVSSISAALV